MTGPRNFQRFVSSLALGAALASGTLLSGCAAVGKRLSVAPDVGAKRQERKEQLIADYEKKRNDATVVAARGRIEQGDYRGAIETLEQLIHRTGGNAEAQLLLADAYVFDRQFDRARAEVEAVLEKTPNDPRALHALGLIYETIGGTAQAEALYARAVEAEPTNELFVLSYQAVRNSRVPKVDTADPKAKAGTIESGDFRHLTACTDQPAAKECVELSAAAFRTGCIPVAVSELQQALEADPNNSQIPVNLAIYALQMGQTDAARIVGEAAVEAFPAEATVHRTLGLAYYRSGQFAEAQKALEKAVSLDNQDALAYFLLGYACQRQGLSQAAEAYLRHAAELDASLAEGA